MAKKTMTPVKAGYNAITKVAYETATAANDGFELKLKSTDELTVILVTNSDTAAKTITVKAPTKGSYAAASSDLTLSLAAGDTAVIRLESAKYANNDGTVLLIPEATTVKAVVVM
jgi:hypothetical protein